MEASPNQGDWLESRPKDPSAEALEESRRQGAGLRSIIIVTLGALLLLILSLDLFICKQLGMIRSQLAEQRPLVQKAVSDYQKYNEPLVRHFSAALQSFAQAHRDFQPILEKYRPQLKAYYTTPPLTSAPAPAPASRK